MLAGSIPGRTRDVTRFFKSRGGERFGKSLYRILEARDPFFWTERRPPTRLVGPVLGLVLGLKEEEDSHERHSQFDP